MTSTVAPRTVLASILNWNTAAQTLACVDTLLAQQLPPGVALEVLVIDNGSAEADHAALAAGLQARPAARLLRAPRNLGFAGGHNLAIAEALQRGLEYSWLVNSDALMGSEAVLAGLVACIEADPRCGAVSPLLADMQDARKIHFYGAFHDWARRASDRPRSVDEARRLAARMPERQWLPGTAVLFRLAALRQTGALDERMFAYYEDDEIGARLAAAGWLCAVAYDVTVRHSMPRRETERPPYYFYLMARNHLLFWHGSTPPAHRRLLLPKLLDQALFDVNRLRYLGCEQRAAAALLGVEDFLRARHGVPDLQRRASLALRLLRALMWLPHRRVLRRMDLPPAAAEAAP